MSDAGPLYETLSRFQWWRRKWAHARPGEGLELRKRLLPPVGGEGPTDGCAGLDRWLVERLAGRSLERALDLGCGFGITAQRLVALGASEAVGVTPSRFQIRRASEAAAQGGLAGCVRFVCQPMTASLPGPFDAVFAIEALGHERDLAGVLRAVHAALAPGGVFVWLEDMLAHPLDGDPDVAELAWRWHSPPLRDVDAARAALQAAGFAVRREIDLTAQVPFASSDESARRAKRLRRWRNVIPLPSARRLLDAFLGGLALERLYARGAVRYRVWMCERPPEAA